MLFNSLEYFIFLAIVLVLYNKSNHNIQNIILLFASYVFYSFWDVRFLTLIILSTSVDFIAGLGIVNARRFNKKKKAKIYLLLSIITNLVILGFFKYYGFFVDTFIVLLNNVGVKFSLPMVKFILPVGISFYTFQTMSYTIDIYMEKMKPTNKLLDFALFVAFFPQLVAGPIERAKNLLPQIQKKRINTIENWQNGIYLIIIGLVRKVVIADTAGLIVDKLFANPSQFTSLQLLTGIILYAIQIYGDFSGYSNIARGTSLLLGFKLMRNFHHPYFARNITDFWRRWHISLSTWLRDYLYIPLGGNRKGKVRKYINLFITMLLGGLWHGASWNFVLWGFLHGLYLTVHKLISHILPPINKNSDISSLKKSFYGILTFSFVCLAWIPFRLKSVKEVSVYFTSLLKMDFDGQLILIPLIALTSIVLLIDLPQALSNDEFWLVRIPRFAYGALLGFCLMLIIFSVGYKAPFIYFQF